MLRKSKIAVAVLAAAAATSAYAVNLSEDGTGQVLLFPYYNVNNEFVTNFNITNTTSNYKAVKLRFRESKESNDVLDFNVYMTPYDSWTASITMNKDTGLARITTDDETCTYPDKSALQSGVDFIDLYEAVDANDTTEGYLEVYEMGVIANNSDGNIGGVAGTGLTAETGEDGTLDGVAGAIDVDGDGVADSTSIPAGLKHDSDGMPADCSVIARAWSDDPNKVNRGFSAGTLTIFGIAGDDGDIYSGDVVAADLGDNNGMLPPSGGLTGFSILLHPATGAAYVADATIIDNYATAPQHYRSDDSDNYLLPSLASGDVQIARVPAADGSVTDVTWGLTNVDPGLVDDIAPNDPRVSGQNPFAISHVLALTGLSNDYFVETGIVNGATDWVVTFPMKKHSIWNSEAISGYCPDPDDPSKTIGADGVLPGNAVLKNLGEKATAYSCVYDDVLPSATAIALTAQDFDGSDVVFRPTYYDREEQLFTPAPGSPGFSPVLDTETPAQRLTREVNIISIQNADGSTDSVLGTPSDNVFTLTLEEGWDDGWMMFEFDDRYKLSLLGGGQSAPFEENGTGTTEAVSVVGVPAIGFSAIRADIGPASVGETIPHTRYKADAK